MPIAVKDYKWSETEKQVFITLPLKGVKAAKTDIFSTSEYIKVNFPPYLFEVTLFDSVIEDQCSVRIGNGVVEFFLVKRDEGLWGKLMSTKSREEMVQKREEAVLASHQREKELMEKRVKIKKEEEKFAIKEQMKIEQEKRDGFLKEKEEETRKAMDELEIWKDSQQNNSTKDTVISTDVWTGKTVKLPPPPRKGGKISFQFTPRPFSTAARESKIPEEEEWLSKMAAARKIQPKAMGNDKETVNERNPEFIKDKATQMFKVGDFNGAINALSKGIDLNPNLPFLFANRAACFLCTGDNEKAIADCCRALELYYPVVPSNYLARAKVFVRRGTAYANTGELELALQDYNAALKLSPDNQSLQEDYEQLKKQFLKT